MSEMQVSTDSFDSSLNQGTVVVRLKASAMDILTDLDATSAFRELLELADDEPGVSGYAQINDGKWDSRADVDSLSKAVSESNELRVERGHDYGYHSDLLVARFKNTVGNYLHQIMGISKPTVAGFSGRISAEYLGLTLAFDSRVATRDTTFSFDNVRTGLPASPGVTYLMPRFIGIGKTLAFANQGVTISAEEALALGLVSELVEEDQDLVNVCVEYIRGLVNQDRIVLRFNREHILPSRDDINAALEEYYDAMSKAIVSRRAKR
jgi:enoyl-CoA hydratase/carnithine racemase